MTPSTPKKSKIPSVPKEPCDDIMYGADEAGFREIVKISIVPDYKVTRSIQVNCTLCKKAGAQGISPHVKVKKKYSCIRSRCKDHLDNCSVTVKV
jgi:hypothetical protein